MYEVSLYRKSFLAPGLENHKCLVHFKLVLLSSIGKNFCVPHPLTFFLPSLVRAKMGLEKEKFGMRDEIIDLTGLDASSFISKLVVYSISSPQIL